MKDYNKQNKNIWIGGRCVPAEDADRYREQERARTALIQSREIPLTQVTGNRKVDISYDEALRKYGFRRVVTPITNPTETSYLWCNTCRFSKDREMCSEFELLGLSPGSPELKRVRKWQGANRSPQFTRSIKDIKSSCPFHEAKENPTTPVYSWTMSDKQRDIPKPTLVKHNCETCLFHNHVAKSGVCLAYDRGVNEDELVDWIHANWGPNNVMCDHDADNCPGWKEK